MKTLPVIFLCLAGAAAGAGIGWALRRSSAADTAQNSAAAAQHESAGMKPGTRGAAKSETEDAAGELVRNLEIQSGALRWLLLLGAAERATPDEMSALLAAAKNLPGGERMIAARWAAIDPLHMLKTLGRTKEHFRALNYLMEEWAKNDPDAAVAALRELRSLPVVQDLRSNFIHEIIKHDPALALHLMGEWSGRHHPNESQAFKDWVKADPRAAAETVRSVKNLTGGGRDFLVWVGQTWAGTDPGAALQYAAGLSTRTGGPMLETVLKQWCQQDMQKASDAVAQIADPAARNRASAALVGEFARTDPKGALAWASENLSGPHRDSAVSSIVTKLAEEDQAAARAFVRDLEPGPLRVSAMQSLLRGDWLFNLKPEAVPEVVAWIHALPDVQERDRVMQDSLPFLMRQSPEAIAAELTRPGSPPPSARVCQMAAHSLATRNPEAAMQWAGALPDDVRVDAVSSVLDNWSSHRPAAATDWVRSQPAGAARDRYVRSLTTRFAWSSFATNLAPWMDSLSGTDRTNALAALKSVTLTPEQNAVVQQWK